MSVKFLDVKIVRPEIVSIRAQRKQELRRHKALTQAGVLVSGEGPLLSSPQTSASLDTAADRRQDWRGVRGRALSGVVSGVRLVRGGLGGGVGGRTGLVEQDIEMAANRGS